MRAVKAPSAFAPTSGGRGDEALRMGIKEYGPIPVAGAIEARPGDTGDTSPVYGRQGEHACDERQEWRWVDVRRQIPEQVKVSLVNYEVYARERVPQALVHLFREHGVTR